MITLSIAILSFVIGAAVAAGAYEFLRYRRDRINRELDKFIVMEDYRAESGAANGDLIHFRCRNGHESVRVLEQFGTLPNCSQCGSLLEPYGFTPITEEPEK